MLSPLKAPTSLHARLTITYVVALSVGLLLFAAFSLTVIEEVSKSALDARLAASARAFVGSLSVVHGEVQTDRRSHLLLRAILSPQQNAAIIRRDGTVLLQLGAIPARVVASVKSTTATPRYETIRTEGTPVRLLTVSIPGVTDTVVILWRPIDFIVDYRRTAYIVFGCTIVVIVLSAFWIGDLIAKRGLQPLRQIAEIASEIEARDLSRRLTTPISDDEVAQFCAAFNRMLDRLEFAFAQQRQFTADASHELRAPLAVIRAEAELALRRPRDAECYRASLASIQREVAHLEDLIDALLTIARAEAGVSETKQIEVSCLVRRAVERMQRLAASKEVVVESAIADDAVSLGDPDQFERIIVALLHNALKFGRDGGVISVGVRTEDGIVRIVIRDDGPGFSDEALAHAFDRFWSDAGEGASGSGLGLAIAKSAIERWGGRIQLANRPCGGGEISIMLPACPLPETLAGRS